METTKKQLEILEAEKKAADKAYFSYRAKYNKEHEVERPHLSSEIITLHKKGKTKKEIVEMGYNKNYVNQQINFYVKQKRVMKTTVAHYFPKKKKD